MSRGRPARKRAAETAALPLLHNLADGSCAHRVPAFANGKPQAFLHRHRRDQLNHQLYVVSRHHHLGARGKLCHSGDIRRAQIKLRAIYLEERRVPSAFFFRQNVNLSFELIVSLTLTTFYTYPSYI